MALIACSECKEMISSSATSCPRCGFQIAERLERADPRASLNHMDGPSPTSKAAMRQRRETTLNPIVKVISIILGVVIGTIVVIPLGVIALGLALDSMFVEVNPSSPNYTPTSKTMQQSSTSKAKDSKVRGVQTEKPDGYRTWKGAPKNLGDYRYTVNEVYQTQSIGKNSYLTEKASPGATFVIVEYTIENITTQTATVLSNDMFVEDFDGKVFQPSSEGLTAYSMASGADLIISQLQPGIPRLQVAVFEMPAGAAQDFEIVIPEKGWGSKELRIRFVNMVAQ